MNQEKNIRVAKIFINGKIKNDRYEVKKIMYNELMRK